MTWCNGYHGPTIGIGYTFDFKDFTFLENSLLPFNRNGVLFPRKINGEYVLLSRPSDNGHTPFGDIYLNRSPDLIHWGKHRFVMGVKDGWQSTKIGAGPVPIDTEEGWLMIYHDRPTGVTQRVSVDTNGIQGNEDSYFPTISADGINVAFFSYADNLVTGDINESSDVFVYTRAVEIKAFLPIITRSHSD